MKTCIDCKQSKSFDDFHKKTSAKDGRQTRCKECNRAKARGWQKENAERHEAYWRARDSDEEYRATQDLKKKAKKYGLTVEELIVLLGSTDGKCQLCNKKPKRWLVVDHCHTSLNVRGVLCENCNLALGNFYDDPALMRRAADYVEHGLQALK